MKPQALDCAQWIVANKVGRTGPWGSPAGRVRSRRCCRGKGDDFLSRKGFPGQQISEIDNRRKWSLGERRGAHTQRQPQGVMRSEQLPVPQFTHLGRVPLRRRYLLGVAGL